MSNAKAVATPNVKDANAGKATGEPVKQTGAVVVQAGAAPKPEAAKSEAVKQEGQTVEAAKPEALTPEDKKPDAKKDEPNPDAEWLRQAAAKAENAQNTEVVKPEAAAKPEAGKPDAPLADATPTKMVVATEIYKRMVGVKGVTRKDIIQAFIEDVKLTKAGASTYYQMIKKKGTTPSK